MLQAALSLTTEISES